jgi:hypothetical protein
MIIPGWVPIRLDSILMTVEEYAGWKGYSRQRIYQFIKQGRLKPTVIRHHWFIDSSATIQPSNETPFRKHKRQPDGEWWRSKEAKEREYNDQQAGKFPL